MGISKDLVEIMQFLLPGFVTAAVFYNLTSYPKPSQFERVIHALIFTLFIKVGVAGIEYLFGEISQLWGAVQWNETASVIFSILIAIGFALLLSYFLNNDTIHKRLRDIGITRETSFPSEWFGSFLENVTFVVLHLHDGRRLYGWPIEWPSESAKGHFFIRDPIWIHGDGHNAEEKQITGVSNILIDVKDVKWVEFIEKSWEEENG